MAEAEMKSDGKTEAKGAESDALDLPDDSDTDVDVEELIMKLSSAEKLAEERLDQLMRCRADLDNVMKRAAKDREDHVKYASEKLVGKLLPVLDSMEQAAKHDEGSRVLYNQLLDILSAEGLVPIVARGCKFDPYRHEALFQVQKEDQEEGTVVEEIQKGYLYSTHVLRFAKVAVSKK
ncbi:MAG TPA: nucleotide exchange factor GrpE [Methanothrix soehngenii]|nr:nucleotide exchange factor GrpE [Methanothrix soehngenii]HPT19588.1 nucleotide exchange factor GrpE [Methanothrix sp.]